MSKSAVKKTLLILSGAGLFMLSQGAFAHAAHCKDTELGTLMDGMKTDLKAYVKAFKSSDAPEMQTRLDRLLVASEKSKDYLPQKLQDQSPVKKDQAREYLQGMDKLTGLLTELQLATGDKLQTKQLLGQIKKHSKSSHEDFRKECD